MATVGSGASASGSGLPLSGAIGAITISESVRVIAVGEKRSHSLRSQSSEL